MIAIGELILILLADSSLFVLGTRVQTIVLGLDSMFRDRGEFCNESVDFWDYIWLLDCEVLPIFRVEVNRNVLQ